MKPINHLFRLLVVLLGCYLPAAATAQTLTACGNVQTGGRLIFDKGVYSDCAMTNPSIPSRDRPYLSYTPPGEGPASIGILLVESADLSPSPVATDLFGEWDLADAVVEDMGGHYAGDCSDMSAANPTLDLSITNPIDGNVYCGRYSSDSGASILIRGTLDGSSESFRDPAAFVVTASMPGGPAPAPTTATPVPALPVFGLFVLAGLVASFGRRGLSRLK